ncbi:MAG: HK97 family phage prohead protease [Selenomonadaceae bacterium]|nr:HK97 family phage prohead protease [Selenomonadaceae bacterium]
MPKAKSRTNPATSKEDALTCVRSYARQEFRAAEGGDEGDGEGVAGTRSITGHPAVFNSPADIGGYFEEIIEPGAFDDCDMTDVLLFTNHRDMKIPLARSRRNNGNSTMTLTVDDIGLKMDADLDVENNQEARALFSAIERGDMDGMSFCFRVKEQTWDNLDTDYPTRHITKIAKVYEVSAVNEPAYADTDISARDKAALESARKAVETARSASLESEDELEIYRLRNEIMAQV